MKKENPAKPHAKTLVLRNNIAVPCGNFAFLDELELHDDVKRYCRDAENRLLEDQTLCVQNLRKAMETVGYHFEARSRLGTKSGEAYYTEYENVRKSHMEQSDSPVVKGYIKEAVREICGAKKSNQFFFSAHFDAFAQPETKDARRKANKRKDGSYEIRMVDFIYHFYTATSEAAHPNAQIKFKEALYLLEDFVHFFQRLYNREEAFDIRLCPLQMTGEGEPFYPVPEDACKKLDVSLQDDTGLWVRQETDVSGAPMLRYYLFKNIAIQKKEMRRDRDSLKKLWDANAQHPDNVLKPIREESVGASEFYKYDIYQLPSRPYSLTESAVKRLEDWQKEELVRGMIGSVASLHALSPPIPHRGLKPECFLICDTRTELHPLLYRFDTAKDQSLDAEYTVFSGMLLKFRENGKSAFFSAPELLEGDVQEPLKTDIFSLGRLILWLYGGGTTDVSAATSALPKDVDAIALRMTDPAPDKRPDISEAASYFAKTAPERAVASVKGPREKQEDAFYLSDLGEFHGDDFHNAGECALPLIAAVFDGVGSAENSAQVVETLVRATHKQCKELLKKPASDRAKDLKELALFLDETTTSYGREHDLYLAASTVALAMIEKSGVAFMNVGDSRIYLIDDNANIALLSEIHRSATAVKNNTLYQYLGVSHRGVLPSPYTGFCQPAKGARLLLCTDGLTDALSEDEIGLYVAGATSAKEAAQTLMDEAKKRGFTDNTTVIVVKL